MIFGLFGKKKKEEPVAAPAVQEESYAVGGTNIRYQPALIESMKSDHVKLLDLYTDIQMASETKNFKKVAAILNDFRGELEDHLLKENVNLYIYLTHLLKSDAMNSELIAKFRKEMDGIASVALKFLAK
ncbi:MAG: hemerythrin domain-containing protein, partial [Gammaproteobacteria bacterium]|nr:hemerythrin domain-containing protein [Gammaproteobacteria bacterium]